MKIANGEREGKEKVRRVDTVVGKSASETKRGRKTSRN